MQFLSGLTGTPLIGKDRTSRDTFGDYIHKYYYNASIADGYTLKLIREDIETNYKIQLKEALKEVEILKGDVEKRIIYAHAEVCRTHAGLHCSGFYKKQDTIWRPYYWRHGGLR